MDTKYSARVARLCPLGSDVSERLVVSLRHDGGKATAMTMPGSLMGSIFGGFDAASWLNRWPPILMRLVEEPQGF